MEESVWLAPSWLWTTAVCYTVQLLKSRLVGNPRDNVAWTGLQNCDSDHCNFLDFSVDLKKRKKKNIIIILKCILGVAKLKYDAGFMHQCKRLHLISRNHKIFWRRETRGYVFICDSLLSAVQPTWFYEYTVYCIQYANTFLYICV